jgi:peptide/nickel transport system permease protein
MNPWLALCPGLAIFISVLGFNLFGDGLRDALDPRLK